MRAPLCTRMHGGPSVRARRSPIRRVLREHSAHVYKSVLRKVHRDTQFMPQPPIGAVQAMPFSVVGAEERRVSRARK